MLWGLSLQFWQTVVFWLWAIAAGTGGIAVAASFGSSVISYYISDETQTIADREIAKAKETAGAANEAAANAYKRAAELSLEVERERTARLLIEERVSSQGEQVQKLMPRRLTDGQRIQLLRLLSAHTNSISIAQDMAAADAKPLANELAEVFNLSSWRVATPSVMGIGNPPPSGFALRVADTISLTESEGFVRDALEKAGILFDLQPGRRVPPPGIIPGSGFAGMPVEMYPEVEIILTTPLR